MRYQQAGKQMPWRVGLDEAGYGPNLGPLVVCSTAIRVTDPTATIWKLFPESMRQAGGKKDQRLIVDDSKKVYSGGQGLEQLETGVLALLACSTGAIPGDLASLLQATTSADCRADLQQEFWFTEDVALPKWAPLTAIDQARGAVLAEAPTDTVFGPMQAMIVPTGRFNQLLKEWQVKSGIVQHALIQLLAATNDLQPKNEDIFIAIDRLGGRLYYTAFLSEAFPGCWVQTVKETAGESVYEIIGHDRTITVRFAPRSDADHWNVALSSMLAKYLRELLMVQFNEFWQRELPNLQPTAGYPVDALRFMKEISSIQEKKGITREALWREK
ncbi:MAG: hypothetical protein R3B84_11355 [Zavarzinella sp.]